MRQCRWEIQIRGEERPLTGEGRHMWYWVGYGMAREGSATSLRARCDLKTGRAARLALRGSQAKPGYTCRRPAAH